MQESYNKSMVGTIADKTMTPILQGNTRVVLKCLLELANDPQITITIADIRKQAKISRATAIRHLHSLRALGLIEIQGSKGRACIYSIKLRAFEALEVSYVP